MEDFPLPVRANRAFTEQDYSNAIALYTEALEYDDQNCMLLCNRSAAYFKMELFKTSLKDAEAAIAIDSGCTKAWYRKGLALAALGRQSEAQNAWKNAMHIGGDIDVYMEVMTKLGASTLPSSSAVPGEVSRPISAPPTSKTNGKNPIMPKTAPVQVSTTSEKPKPPSSSREEPPRSEPKITQKPPSSFTKAMDFDEADEVKSSGAPLTLSAAKGPKQPDPLQLAAIVAAQKMISHGIGNASVDEQIALGYLQVNTGNYAQGLMIFNKLLEVTIAH